MDFFEGLENDELFEAAVGAADVEVVEQDDEFLEICVDVGLGIVNEELLVQE